MASRSAPRQRLFTALDELDERASVIDVGVNTILKEAGVAKASLYDHFGSKEVLIVEWLAQRQDRWFGWFDEYVEHHASREDPAGEIDAAFGFLESWLAREDFSGCPFVGLFLQLKDASHPAAERCRAYADRLHGFFSHRFRVLGASRTAASAAATGLLDLYLGAVVVKQLHVGRRVAETARQSARLLVEMTLGVGDE